MVLGEAPGAAGVGAVDGFTACYWRLLRRKNACRPNTVRIVADRMPTTLVTGATSGLGLAAAHHLAAKGHHVLVHGRTPAKVDAVVHAIAAKGGHADGYVADLSSMSDVRKLGDNVAKGHPSLDGLLNNAGSFDGDYTGERVVTAEGNEYTLAVNVLAPFLLTALLLPSLRASGRARVVISSSVSMGAADALGASSGAGTTTADFPDPSRKLPGRRPAAQERLLGAQGLLSLQTVRRDAGGGTARAVRWRGKFAHCSPPPLWVVASLRSPPHAPQSSHGQHPASQ